jgi:hypothetical protein
MKEGKGSILGKERFLFPEFRKGDRTLPFVKIKTRNLKTSDPGLWNLDFGPI